METPPLLPLREQIIQITPTQDGPLTVRGNIEIISGIGRVVARQQAARLCRCGHSNTKPFCDGSHAKADFKSEQ
jgi:CDGSH-type Zn-finger protein